MNKIENKKFGYFIAFVLLFIVSPLSFGVSNYLIKTGGGVENVFLQGIIIWFEVFGITFSIISIFISVVLLIYLTE